MDDRHPAAPGWRRRGKDAWRGTPGSGGEYSPLGAVGGAGRDLPGGILGNCSRYPGLE